jgi:hypothetical protein
MTVPGRVGVRACFAQEVVTTGQATATNGCTPLTVTGSVISRNGVALTPPIPVVGGQVTLGVGTYIVQWTASGTPPLPPPGTQTVVVAPTIETNFSFILEDRARLRDSRGADLYAAMLNAGSGTGSITRMTFDTFSGGIISVAPVDLFDRARVDQGGGVVGNVLSAGAVTRSSTAVVTGTVTAFGSVSLPALPTLPAFPAPTLGSRTVDSGTLNLAPGSYTTITVNGGTLVMAAGNYFFQQLTINGGTVRAVAATRIHVQTATNFAFRSPIRTLTTLATQPVFLGLAATGASAVMSLEAPFDGMLVAPGAIVNFGIGAGITYTGSFFARGIDVRPQSVLVCLRSAAPAP